MQWLEISIQTEPEKIEDVATALTAGGFADLVLEDQSQFESFLDENRAYWDYIDEQLQEKLRGLCQIKLYLEQDDTVAMSRLEQLLAQLRSQGLGQLEMQAA